MRQRAKRGREGGECVRQHATRERNKEREREGERGSERDSDVRREIDTQTSHLAFSLMLSSLSC